MTTPGSRRGTGRKAEEELLQAYLSGDLKAGNALVRAARPWILHVARKYQKWGIPLDDLVQEGSIGLLRAVRKYDPARGVRLGTYAAFWIRAEIREYTMKNYRLVRLGTTKRERKAVREARTQTILTPQDLARVSGLSETRCHVLLPMLLGREASLSSESSSPLASTLPSPEECALEKERRQQDARAVSRAFAPLSSREETVLSRRFLEDDAATLLEIGTVFGVTKERIRQVEARALQKARCALLPGESAWSSSSPTCSSSKAFARNRGTGGVSPHTLLGP